MRCAFILHYTHERSYTSTVLLARPWHTPHRFPMSLANGAKYLGSVYLFPCLLNHKLSAHYYKLMVKTRFCNHIESLCLFYYGFTRYALIRWIGQEVLESRGAFNSMCRDVIIMLRITPRLPLASGNN